MSGSLSLNGLGNPLAFYTLIGKAYGSASIYGLMSDQMVRWKFRNSSTHLMEALDMIMILARQDKKHPISGNSQQNFRSHQMSEAGERNKGDLLQQMSAEFYWDARYSRTPLEVKEMDRVNMSRVIGLLIHKGYLTEAGIIAAKAIDDGE